MNAMAGAGLTLIGTLFIYISYVLGAQSLTAESPLATLYIRGATSSLWESGIFLAVCGIAFLLFRIPSIRHSCIMLATNLRRRFDTLPTYGKHAVVCAIFIVSLFALNASGIVNGYFHSDDFQVLAENNANSISELLFLPYSDHLLPLYRMEVAFMYNLFGVNPIPYNVLLLVLMALIPFTVYLLVRALHLNPHIPFVFFVLFSGSILMGEFLSGFYMVSMYPHILVFSLFALLFYVYSQNETASGKKQIYHALSILMLLCAVFFDIAGLWAPCAYVVFSYFYTVATSKSWSPLHYAKKNIVPMLGVFAVLALFAGYVFSVLSLHPHTFMFAGGPFSFAVFAKNFYDVLTAGVIAQLFAPSAGLIISQPRFAALLSLWAIFMLTSLVAFLVLVYGNARFNKEYRPYVYGFLLILFGVSVLPAIGRPSGHVAGFFPVQQIIMSFFWYVLILAIALAEFLRKNVEKRAGIVIALCVLVLGWQHVFAFYNDDNVAQVKDSRQSVERLQSVLVPALNELSNTSGEGITVPDLRGSYINQYVFGNDLGEYRAFLDLDSNITFTPVREGPYRASTSPAFIKDLGQEGGIRDVYLASVELEEVYRGEPLENQQAPTHIESDGTSSVTLKPYTINPAELHELSLDITVPKEQEKVFVGVAFKNDFGATDTVATIRLDQFSKPVATDGERRYVIDVDLNQMYAFALSRYVSNLELILATPGSYVVHGYTLR